MDPHAGASSQEELNYNNPNIEMGAPDVKTGDDQHEEPPYG